MSKPVVDVKTVPKVYGNNPIHLKVFHVPFRKINLLELWEHQVQVKHHY